MIPGAFEYHRPADIRGALAVLNEHGDEARVIAGGHSLIPMMKLRMTAISHLVDLQDIAALRGITIEAGRVTLGAMVTQSDLVAHDGLSKAAPILREAALQIADPQVRYMGTIGGNVANGDPGNDMPGLMQCLDAHFTLEGAGGSRDVAARDFYESAYVTARGDDEILTRVSFAVPTGGWAYEKQKRKIGDYATAAAAVQITKANGTVSACAIALTNLADTPLYCTAASAALIGTTCDAASVKAAAAAAVAITDPSSDNRGPAEFKRHVAGIIIARAIQRAWSRA